MLAGLAFSLNLELPILLATEKKQTLTSFMLPQVKDMRMKGFVHEEGHWGLLLFKFLKSEKSGLDPSSFSFLY